MDPFQSFDTQFNPQIYESSNVLPSTDRLFSFSGFQAGLMTNQSNSQAQQQQFPQQNAFLQSSYLQSSSIPSQSITVVSAPPPPPLPTSTQNDHGRYSGMYANTGFDMLSILSRVSNRPNPQIHLGPVDLSCSFVVVDAKQYDLPLVYASPMFERLTGYAPYEVVGRNCRFLQAPDGRVAIGSRRKYTDNSTIYHIKTHIVQGKESQSSIINYRKTGQPFVNLLTVIPISWGSTDEIDYFIGLQVDLVEQPNAIFQSMKDGTYTVNYRNSTIPPSIQADMNVKLEAGVDLVEEWTRPVSPKSSFLGNSEHSLSLQTVKNESSKNAAFPQQQHSLIETETSMDVEALIKEANTDEGKFKRYWHELLLDQSPDFIHVLTIKGIFLYCSESTQNILEYEPAELVGKPLKSICHPSDITTVMRELKQSSNHSTEPVNLIYRVRRKNSGYMWIECYGKLRNEDGRGRKYVVLSGRERPIYQLPRNTLTMGQKLHDTQSKSEIKIPGVEDHEFWGKLSADGLLLYVSWTCMNILGSPPSEIVGMSLYQLMRSNRTVDLTRALAEVKEGKIVYLKHALLNSSGDEVMVASTFYPDGKASLHENPSFVLMQTKFVQDHSDQPDREPVFVTVDPDIKKKGRADFSLADTQKYNIERVVEELDIGRDANWQYELHQLRISNKKLRDDLSSLLQRAKQDGYEEACCETCYRRLPGLSDLQEYTSNEPLLCSTCSIQNSQ